MFTSNLFIGITTTFMWPFNGRKVHVVVLKNEEEIIKERLDFIKKCDGSDSDNL